MKKELEISNLKLWIIYSGIILLGLASFLIMIFMSVSPEQLLIGDWVEYSWEYEFIDRNENGQIKNKNISKADKHLISEDLIFHKAEVWNFSPYGKLKLKGDGVDKSVDWKLKGRGNILKLNYQNHKIERYTISELSDSVLIINFEADIEARGIAKLTFKRSK